ncbi:MAG: hypothetical protein AAGI30_08690 [Planctomycetota bacterium]
MKYTYSEFDNEGDGRFLSPDDLFPHQGFVDFLLEYGEQGLDALEHHPDEQIQRLLDEMKQAGLLEEDGQGNLRPTPRLVRGVEHRSFLEIFQELKAGVKDGHDTPESGPRGERSEGTKPYQFGDPVSELDMNATMRNAIRRVAAARAESRGTTQGANAAESLFPLQLSERDFELFNLESTTDTALCILIDLSGSMMRYGRHIAAKKVALGMAAMVRRMFPQDTIDYIGFASIAEKLTEADLPMVMPKPITTREWEVRVRCPLDQASETHPHFTNLHHGLRMARQVLRRRGAANKQLFIITDGSPTAHLTEGKAGPANPILNLIYPPSDTSAEATLNEAYRAANDGIRFSSFALIEEYWGMDWVGFVDQMTRLTRGSAFYCTAQDLSATIMESYLSGKRTKKPIG